MKTPINKAIEKFTELKGKSTTLVDMIFLDGVLAVLDSLIEYEQDYLNNDNAETDTINLCGCGYAEPTHPIDIEKGGRIVAHELGKNGCRRKLAAGSLIPTNFRTVDGVKVCDVNGYTITEYTLKYQRMYAKNNNGYWTLPKDESSINSIDA